MPMSPVWEDSRVVAGTRAMLALRERHRVDGAEPIGWKVAFSSPAAMEQLGIDSGVVGFLTRKALIESGTTCVIDGWAVPALEPELAIHLGANVGASASDEEILAAISGLGASIELLDLDMPILDLEAMIATNLFQRRVVLGPNRLGRAGCHTSGVKVTVESCDAVIAETDDAASVVGTPLSVVRAVAELLGACDAVLRAGEVIISGSVVPMVFPQAGEHITCRFSGIGELDVRLARSVSGSTTPAVPSAVYCGRVRGDNQ
jgi:2-keto-4-pentenoate hydratase